MIRNYLLIAFRNMTRNKGFSFINIMGLAIGMTVTLFILEYVGFELSFDGFHQKKDSIYRVVNDRFQEGDLVQHGTITYAGVGQGLVDDYPEIIRATTLTTTGQIPVIIDDQVFIETGPFAVDEYFLEIFDFPLLAGDRETCLKEVRKIALSRKLAQKYFGEDVDFEELIGQTILIDEDRESFMITAVFEDIPQNSHLEFDMLLSFKTIEAYYENFSAISWTNSDFWHYVEVSPGFENDDFSPKLEEFSQVHFKGTEVSGSEEKFSLQPLSEARLYSDFQYEIGTTGNGKAVWAMLIIAGFILAIAWINYVNLATAKAMDRAREVGVRKVLGAVKSQLIFQFLTEAFLLNILAVFIAFTFVQVLQPFYNQLVDWNLDLSAILWLGSSGWLTFIWVITGVLVGILISGFYPAFVLSAYQPVKVLKGQFQNSFKGVALRRGLVVFQFICSIVLMAAAITVFQQVNYMNDQDLGLEIDQILVVSSPEMTGFDSTFIERTNSFKNTLIENPNIKAATTSRQIPGRNLGRVFNFRVRDSRDYTLRNMAADYDFVNTYQINLLAGRDFRVGDHNPDFSKLSTILVNESAVKMLGYSPDSAVGLPVSFWGMNWNIIGIMEDFHQVSLHTPIEPLVIIPAYSTNSFISLRVAENDISETIAYTQEVYDRFFPGNAFEYFFLSERFDEQYESDQRFGTLFGSFSLLAVIIACLGLFGLVSFNARLKMKEIGIRKVLGANALDIWLMLNREIMILLLVGVGLAWPLIFWGVNEWLSDYAYRMDISPGLFL
ncbi:MAG: ABC transporter permease, partial [Bacteroidetes bacterium]|nr:ABC transporter permease [Bacteroidota bacterium]